MKVKIEIEWEGMTWMTHAPVDIDDAVLNEITDDVVRTDYILNELRPWTEGLFKVAAFSREEAARGVQVPDGSRSDH